MPKAAPRGASARSSSTPTLVVDLDVLDAQIQAMSARADAVGVTLRPHVKTHKCVEIARRQQRAGAKGITVATIGEAETFVAHGFDDIFIAYPLWLDETKADRLAALTDRARIWIGCDSAESARNTWALLRGAPVEVLIEIDSGHHRTGLRPGQAGALAAEIQRMGLSVIGAFTFPGHSYSTQFRKAAALDEAESLQVAAESLSGHVVEPLVLSGWSSPTMEYAAWPSTEQRPGAYVFNDAQQWELGVCRPDQIALTVHASVISHAHGRVVLDSGSKSLAADRAPYASGHGRLLDHPDARIVMLSEHHAVVEMNGPAPELGERVRVVPNHCCNAVALAEEYVAVRGDVEVDRWPIEARGANN